MSPIHGTLNCTTNLGSVNLSLLAMNTFLISLEIEFHHKRQFISQTKKPLFWGVLAFSRRYSLRIISPGQIDRLIDETSIYIYISLRKKQNRSHYDYKCISILLYVFEINQKHEKINRTSSDLMDKIIQNRHRKEGWEGIEKGWWAFSFSPLPVLLFYCRWEL